METTVWKKRSSGIRNNSICQLLQSDLLIPQIEVTLALKRSLVGRNEVTLKNLVLVTQKKQQFPQVVHKGAGRYSDGFPEAWGVTKNCRKRWTYLIFKSNKKGSNPIRICSQEIDVCSFCVTILFFGADKKSKLPIWYISVKISYIGWCLTNTSLNDFAHIPWEDTPNFPKPPQRKKFLHKLLVSTSFWYLPGVCGWNLWITAWCF